MADKESDKQSWKIRSSKELKDSLSGPFPLQKDGISEAPLTSGVYLLGSSEKSCIYIGRSEINLRDRIRNHFPDNEKDPSLKENTPDHFYYVQTYSLREAYELECRWYHELKPICNIKHPPKPYPLVCPICKE
jgi:excinuclease UvrABC nuclease subunit